MPETKRKGPLPPEYAAINYATGLYKRLRCEHGWRADIFALLRQEYGQFVRLAIMGDFGTHSMWEYAQLVEATHQYLRYKQTQTFSTWFHKKVYADLEGIAARLKLFEFDEQERETLRRALRHMESIIEGWEAPNEARD